MLAIAPYGCTTTITVLALKMTRLDKLAKALICALSDVVATSGSAACAAFTWLAYQA